MADDVKTILICEDEQIIQMGLKKFLNNSGYERLVFVQTGEAAIESASTIKPNVVLMDIKLSGKIDGITAGETIMNHHKIPVIFITAHSDGETLKRISKLPFSDYITKPYSEARILESLEKAINFEIIL